MNAECEGKTRNRVRRKQRRRYSWQTEPDCWRQMQLYRRRLDVMWDALYEMGVTTDGDGLPNDHN